MVGTIAATTDTTAAAAAMKKSLGMNKDDFMKLFIAQLQYQDPLKPQDPSAMLDQLSQMSLVEQSYNNNTALKDLLAAQNSSTTMNSVSFIGKNVKANGSAVAFDGTSPPSLQFNLPAAVDAATVTISDGAGRTVRTATLGAQQAGDGTFTWDGHDSSGTLIPAGAYSFAVTGRTTAGTDIVASSYITGRVDGVDINNGKPNLTIGSVSVALSDVISVKGV